MRQLGERGGAGVWSSALAALPEGTSLGNVLAEGSQRSLHICRVVPRREIGKQTRCPGVGQRRDRSQRNLGINLDRPRFGGHAVPRLLSLLSSV